MLHVGPESAGAEPGPVAYGRSDRPTVTDAHVFLGHVAEGRFLGGALALDHDAVKRAFEGLGKSLGVSAVEAARGVLDVARAAMRRAIGVMTMQRGKDPERLPLVAFGGAGGLHGAALAAALRMPAALVPLHPGALSARGMTCAEPLQDLARTALEPLAQWPRKRRADTFRSLGRRASDLLRAGGQRAKDIELSHSLDLRYRGQSFELRLVERSGKDPAEAFHRAHEELYGYQLREREIELVCLRTRARVPQPLEKPKRVRAKALPARAIVGERRAIFERAHSSAVIDRAQLSAGHRFEGPALVEDYSGTTLVPPGWSASVTAQGHLLLRRGS